MTWPHGRSALPVYPDLTSLVHTADDLGIERTALVWMHCTPRELYYVPRDACERRVALTTIFDRSTPKYFVLNEVELLRLAEGR